MAKTRRSSVAQGSRWGPRDGGSHRAPRACAAHAVTPPNPGNRLSTLMYLRPQAWASMRSCPWYDLHAHSDLIPTTDHAPQKLYREPVRKMSAAHLHTSLTDDRHAGKSQPAEHQLRRRTARNPSANRRGWLRTDSCGEVVLDGESALKSSAQLVRPGGRRQWPPSSVLMAGAVPAPLPHRSEVPRSPACPVANGGGHDAYL